MPDGFVLPDWPRGMREDVAALYVGVSASWLRQELAAGRFPPAVRLSPGRVVWLKDDLDRWLDEKAGRPHASHDATALDPVAELDAHFRGHRAS